ncbi:MAG: restriction endonuclease [Candidatus Omnitrophica bacterium]|nr:restriction endonuclease [Candidatus Omnitrophota bacterium]
MDKWARKTVRLVKEGNYLDQLQEIYPVIPKARVVSEKNLLEIREAFAKKNASLLLNALLQLERFPYDESYAKFLRSDPTAIARNPKTVNRICEILFTMGLEKVMAGVTAPKEANTRRGSEFKRWAKDHFTFVGVKAFTLSKNGILFLDASDSELRNFANAILGAGLEKRPDFVARVDRKFVIGEAKFLSDEGGNQRAAFRDAISVAAHPSGRAVKVAVLDGIVWIEGSSFYRSIETSSIHIFSALLLNDFLGAL